jgi:hypothetical protein
MGIFFLLLLLLLCVASCEASIWRVRGQHARGAKEAKSKKEAPFLKRKKSRDLRENESERASERERPTHTWRDAGVFVSFIRFYRAAGKFAVLVFFWSWSSSSSPLGPRSRELPPFISTPRPAQIPARNEERGVRSATRTRRRATEKKIAKCKRTYKSNIFKRQRERQRERERERERKREREAGRVPALHRGTALRACVVYIAHTHASFGTLPDMVGEFIAFGELGSLPEMVGEVIVLPGATSSPSPAPPLSASPLGSVGCSW